MAINKVTAPGSSTPSAFWPGTINELNLLKMMVNPGDKIVNGYVKKGLIVNIGGVLFSADADTQIGGTESTSLAVQFAVSGNTATATYVASLSGVTWNDTYNGFYDVDGNLYITDYIYPGNLVYATYGETVSFAQAVSTEKIYYPAINIRAPKSGVWRIYFNRHTDAGNYTMYTKIQKNGVDHGTEMTQVGSATNVALTKDLYFDKNDLITILIGDVSLTGYGACYISKVELHNALIGAVAVS